jgi:hypothetical protein
LQRNQPVRDAVKLARLADQLGRWFEAKVFADLAVSTGSAVADRRAALARLGRRDAAAGLGPTLAEALAAELGAAGDAPATQLIPAADQDASAAPRSRRGP